MNCVNVTPTYAVDRIRHIMLTRKVLPYVHPTLARAFFLLVGTVR